MNQQLLIPFLDIQAAYQELKCQLDEAVGRVLLSGRYLLGPELERFEHDFAAYLGVRHCVGVASGLDALQLALRAMGVGSGDEVIVPANTYVASWLAVSQVGALPVPVEPDAKTYNLNPARIEPALTSRTRLILPVHLYGQPADMDEICEVAREYGLCVLEDAAQSHGAKYRCRPVGSLGDAAAWSFYPAKNLGCFSDGGAVTTNSDDIADHVRLLRNYGSRAKYVHTSKGFNSRLDEIQSAVLTVKLRHLDAWNARRRKIATIYLDGLKNSGVVLPFVPEWAEPVWHLFVVRADRRHEVQRELRWSGIETHIHYPVPPHLQGAYGDLGFGEGRLPISEAIHRDVLSLPIGPHLPRFGAERVVEAVAAATR